MVMLVVQVTDSHIRTVDAPHAHAADNPGKAYVSGLPRQTLEACLASAMGGAQLPQVLVLTGDNAHGDSEGAQPYAGLRGALGRCVPESV